MSSIGRLYYLARPLYYYFQRNTMRFSKIECETKEHVNYCILCIQKLPLNLAERSKIGNNDNWFLLPFWSGAAILYKQLR